MGGIVIQDHMHRKTFRDFTVDGAEKLQDSSCRCRGRQDPITNPVIGWYSSW